MPPEGRIGVAARAVVNQISPASLEVSPAFRRNFVVRAATRAGLPLEDKARLPESRQGWDSRPRRQTGRSLQFVRSRDSVRDQCKHKQIKVIPAAFLTSLRHVFKRLYTLREQARIFAFASPAISVLPAFSLKLFGNTCGRSIYEYRI